MKVPDTERWILYLVSALGIAAVIAADWLDFVNAVGAGVLTCQFQHRGTRA